MPCCRTFDSTPKFGDAGSGTEDNSFKTETWKIKNGEVHSNCRAQINLCSISSKVGHAEGLQKSMSMTHLGHGKAGSGKIAAKESVIDDL